MDALEKPLSYRGVSLQDSRYLALFKFGEGAGFDTLDSQYIESERPDGHPVHVRGQQQGVNFTIEVQVLATTQTNINDLKALFNPKLPRDYLIKVDGDGIQSRALCLVTKVVATGPNIFQIAFRLAEGVWESASQTTTPTATINNSGETFDVVVAGTDFVLPTFTLTPRALLPNSVNWTKQRRIVVANRSDQPLINYPILLITDISTLTITPGADVRIVLDGGDYPRYFSGNKLWSAIDFAAARVFNLGATINNSYTGVITASNATGFTGWDSSGYLLMGDEAIRYTYEEGVMTLVERGALGTTAASHAANLSVYWIEHPELVIIWDYTSPQAANEPLDFQPVIDLANSSNTQFRYPSPFINGNDLRTGAWRREYTEDYPTSKYITGYEGGGQFVFENTTPTSTKPLADNLVLDTPCGLSQSSAAVSLTQSTVAGTAAIPVEGFAWRRVETITHYYYSVIATGDTYFIDVTRFSIPDDDYQTTSEEYTEYSLEQTATLDEEITNVFGYAARGVDTEYTQYISKWTGNYKGIDVTRFSIPFDEQITETRIQKDFELKPDFTQRVTWTKERGTISTITAPTFTAYGTDALGNEGILTLDAAVAIDIYRVRFNMSIPVGRGEDGSLLTDAPEVVVAGTSAKVQLDDIILNFNSAKTPKIVIGAQEDLYMVNGRLYNVNTGDSIYFSIPTDVDQAYQLDCINHKLIEIATGHELAAQMSASNPRLWLPAYRGTNTFAFELDGLASGDGQIDIDVVHRDGWL